MQKALRRTWRVLIIVFLGVPLFLFLLAVVYYHFDPPLSAEVKQVLAYHARPLPPKNNAYFYLLGMFAAKADIPYRKGLEITRSTLEISALVRKYERENKYNDLLSDKTFPTVLTVLPSEDSDNICEKSMDECMQYTKQHLHATKKIVAENAQLLARLREAYAVPAFDETPPSLDFKHSADFNFIIGLGFIHISQVHTIALADIAGRWQSGKRQTALRLLRQDLGFWRMVLRSNISSDTRTNAWIILYRDLTLFSAMLTECRDCAAIEQNVPSLLLPFSKQEMSLRKTMNFDFRKMYVLSQHFSARDKDKSLKRKIIGLFFKRRDFYNRLYAADAQNIKFSECAIHDLAKCYQTMNAFYNRPLDYWSWDCLKNPQAYILLRIADRTYPSVVLSSFHLELYRRLLMIKYDIYHHHVTKSGVRQYLKTLPASLAAPVAGTRVQWQAATQSLLFHFPLATDTPMHVPVPLSQ